MGLTGAMIVRPARLPGQAYDDAAPASTAGNPAGRSSTRSTCSSSPRWTRRSTTWSRQQGVQAVGRLGPARLLLPELLVHQRPQRARHDGRGRRGAACRRSPTTRLPRTHPGDRVLMRVVGGGHDMHPFHHHGQHARVIAVDGFPLRDGARRARSICRTRCSRSSRCRARRWTRSSGGPARASAGTSTAAQPHRRRRIRLANGRPIRAAVKTLDPRLDPVRTSSAPTTTSRSR